VFDNAAFASSSLSMRPANATDAPFLQRLYRSARPDLLMLDGPQEQREALIAQQYGVLQAGTAANHPNAMHFVVEKQGGQVGGLIVDFGANMVHLIYLALIPAVRGQGLGRELVRGLQQAAARVHAPLTAVVWRSNPRARQLYIELGFVVEGSQLAAEQLVWYPDARPMVVVQ
jgi:ribosomal protein S18 acetylase RimI-like enzyme